VANAIHVIVPYRHASTWVFDDLRVGLSQEPFVFGIPEMIDTIVANIPNEEKERGRESLFGKAWLRHHRMVNTSLRSVITALPVGMHKKARAG
jgi:hypothetical protein